MRWIRYSVPVAVLLLLPSLACTAPAPESTPAPAADGEKILRDLEARFARSVAERDREAFLAFWAGDAAIFPETGGPVVDREKIWEHWAPVLENADVSLSWEPSRVEMAASGDLGYTYGRYESRGKNPEGPAVTHKGCYVTIWRKEKDGAWRVVLDIGSADPPPAEGPSGEKPAP